MKKIVLVTIILLLMGFILNAEEQNLKPNLISPGESGNTTIIEQGTPTFSWTSVSWAGEYKIVVFKSDSGSLLSYEEISASETPVISKEIKGRATSWTPSSIQRMETGSNYIWYVQAIDIDGKGFWSEAGTYRVVIPVVLSGIEEKLREKLIEKGISEETLNEVFNDLKTEVKEVVIRDRGKVKKGGNLSGVKGAEHYLYTYYGLGAGGSSTANGNSFFGTDAGNKNTTGTYNTFLGYYAGNDNTTGKFNTFFGRNTGINNTSGYENTFSGTIAGFSNTTGNSNTCLGYSAGFSNSTGSGNLFLGYESGFNEKGSNKLYIENSRTTTPLIYGEFDNNLIRINGNFQATGYLSLNAGANQINAAELNLLDGKTLAEGTANNDQLVTKGYVDENDNVGGGLTGSSLTDRKIAKWDDSGTRLVDSLITEGSGVVSFNGKLGIGTTTPAWPLEVVTTGSNAKIVINRTDGAKGHFVVKTGFATFGTASNHPLRMNVNNIPKVFLLPNGNFGLGVQTPLHPLHLASGAHCTSSGVWQIASSRELKENIVSINSTEAFETLNNLNPVKYNYKKEKDEQYTGFIAEDVPELVATKTRKSLGTMDIVAVLTKVTKEQQIIIIRQQLKINKQNKISKEILKRLQILENKK